VTNQRIVMIFPNFHRFAQNLLCRSDVASATKKWY